MRLPVRQFRKPIEGVLLEAIAGKIDPGESPEEAARRELREETGYDATQIEEIGVSFPVPGYSTEVQHYFNALVVGEPGEKSCDDDERIETAWVSIDDLVRMRKEDAVMDGKLMAAIGFVHLWGLERGRRMT